MIFEVRGVVLRSVNLGESDRIITVYTKERGIISLMVKGARSLKNRNMAATQQFCYSDFVIGTRQDKLYLKESSLIESFFSLRSSIEGLALAQYIAGMGFSNVGLGIVHSMAHQLGAVYDTPHGIANAILLPTVMRFNGVVCADRFREIISHLGRTDAYDMNDQDVINTFVWMIEELSKSVGVTQRVADVGCKEEDLEMLADKAMADACRPGNPREVTKEDFIRLYKEAM